MFLSFMNGPINALKLIEIKYYRRCEESHQPTSEQVSIGLQI